MTAPTIDIRDLDILGVTEEVNECGVCGKVELKRTVAFGRDNTAMVYAGTTCAANVTGRAAAGIDREATAAQAAVDRAAEVHAARVTRYADTIDAYDNDGAVAIVKPGGLYDQHRTAAFRATGVYLTPARFIDALRAYVNDGTPLPWVSEA